MKLLKSIVKSLTTSKSKTQSVASNRKRSKTMKQVWAQKQGRIIPIKKGGIVVTNLSERSKRTFSTAASRWGAQNGI